MIAGHHQLRLWQGFDIVADNAPLAAKDCPLDKIARNHKQVGLQVVGLLGNHLGYLAIEGRPGVQV
jgi:hypothetical protein